MMTCYAKIWMDCEKHGGLNLAERQLHQSLMDCVIVKQLQDRFADAFKAASVPNCIERHKQLEADFWKRFLHYAANEWSPGRINVDFVQQCIAKLKKGKIPSLMAKHILLVHLIIAVHLSLLFNVLLTHGVVPDGFVRGVVIPLIKNEANPFV